MARFRTHVFTKELYPSQTKILDGLTNVSECFFEAFFKGVSTRFGIRIVEKMLRKRILTGWFDLPKSSFGEHKLACVLIGLIVEYSRMQDYIASLPPQTKILKGGTKDEIHIF
jgi:hypothetical protein